MKKEEELAADFLKRLKTSEELDSFINSLRKRGIEQLLNAELDEHLGYPKNEHNETNNSRNGKKPKKLKTDDGELTIEVPRDRNGTFTPIVVPKRKSMASGVEDVIVSLYAKGMSVADISDQIKAVYNFDISSASISRITEKIVEDIHAWQNRPLERLYMVVWMDGIVFRVREDHRVIDKTMYIAIGLRQDGIKEVLGIWLGKNESASFWLAVLTDLKSRGVEDILITATDNLKGFVEAIAAVFPKTTKQICVVHQIRNSCKYVPWKERKAFAADLSTIYRAKDREAAEMALELIDQKWGDKYSIAIKSWRNNWETLTPFLEYPLEIRKIIYTTNTIENLNGKIRKYTKNKLSFPTDESLKKAVYLAVIEASKKWTQPIPNWGLILQQFVIMFESRIKP